jgi:hypothetical protein
VKNPWSRSKDALGIVPDQRNIDYIGFKVVMSPEEFLSLNPHPVSWTRGTLSALKREGVEIAPPFLIAEWDPDIRLWRVIDHEGRHRAKHAMEVLRHRLIPVDIIPRHPRRELRARHLTAEMVSAPFLSDRKAGESTMVVPTGQMWQGRLYEDGAQVE